MATPSSAPTKQITPWAVDPAVVDPLTDFSSPLIVNYETGPSSESIGFDLFNKGCDVLQEKTSPTAVVNMFNETSSAGVGGGYEITFATEHFETDTGNFVNFTDGLSEGTIDFCVRATSYYEGNEIAFRDTSFMVLFSLGEFEFNVITVGINAAEQDTIVTSIDTQFEVKACQCALYDCLNEADTIDQNDPFVMCIYPFHSDPDAATGVAITNFDLKIFAGADDTYTEYDPVVFSSDGWEANSLTAVTVDPEASGKVMISTPIISKFYTGGFTAVNAGGSAFLEFVDPSGARTENFVDYALVVDLNGETDVGIGCINQLLRAVRQFF
jgi:hypothetical protein